MYGASEDVDASTRRTVYARISRGRSPLQALFVMNSPYMQSQAAVLAKAVEAEPQPSGKVKALYRKVLSRDPLPPEMDAALSYLNSSTVPQYAQALLATNEVIFWP